MPEASMIGSGHGDLLPSYSCYVVFVSYPRLSALSSRSRCSRCVLTYSPPLARLRSPPLARPPSLSYSPFLPSCSCLSTAFVLVLEHCLRARA
eukprot:2805197-Pleurochrysis_carterae.AAC.1